jgi:formylglycine-generating enzyme required for sulfatase activity
MAPEQMYGEEVDHRCDQYALACVLYLLCAGKGAKGRFRGLRSVAPDVPAQLSELIERMGAHEAEHRYPSMRDVVRELTSLERPATTGARTPDPAPPVAVRGEGARPVVLPGEGAPESFTNSIGMRFVLVKPGTFRMGSPEGEEDRDDDERQHEVTITRAFYLGVFPVTQWQWQKVTGSNPSYFSRAGTGKDSVRDVSDADLDLFPVEWVSWEDAQDFLKKLVALDEEARSGREYRLPSEAEWEYACRGGHLIQDSKGSHTLPFHFDHPTSSLSSKQANFNGKHPYGGALEGPYLERPSKVGLCEPNALGLFDVHGNVYEWCADWFGNYPAGPASDPSGPSEGASRVVRGGSWFSHGLSCRAALRGWYTPDYRNCYVGFRVAAGPSSE